jgi:hypothetical protein
MMDMMRSLLSSIIDTNVASHLLAEDFHDKRGKKEKEKDRERERERDREECSSSFNSVISEGVYALECAVCVCVCYCVCA